MQSLSEFKSSKGIRLFYLEMSPCEDICKGEDPVFLSEWLWGRMERRARLWGLRKGEQPLISHQRRGKKHRTTYDICCEGTQPWKTISFVVNVKVTLSEAETSDSPFKIPYPCLGCLVFCNFPFRSYSHVSHVPCLSLLACFLLFAFVLKPVLKYLCLTPTQLYQLSWPE